jgi:hypothetical protein
VTEANAAERDAPGWQAIDAALDRLYPGADPMHYATTVSARMANGGREPLDGFSFYARADHWHVITYGMSELYKKESDNPEESGWGFEFTMRVARTPADVEPPAWAANLLQNLARYVFASGHPFGPGQRSNANGPIRTSRPDTALRAVAFVIDPELCVIETPHGRLTFLQVVGITLDEYEAAGRWDTGRMLALLGRHLPLLVTDIERGSLLERADVAAAVAEGIQRDGTSSGLLYIDSFAWHGEPATAHRSAATVLSLGANAVTSLTIVLPGRLRHGRDLHIKGSDTAVTLTPADDFWVTENDDGSATIGVPTRVADELLALLVPQAGRHRLTSAPGLIVEIVRSQIRSQDGDLVGEIG